MLVLWNSKRRYPFDFRSRVRCSRRRSKGGIVFETDLAFMLPSKVMPCFPVFEDNQGAVQQAQNPVTNSNSKHIDVRVPSEFQHADILTKALAFDLFAFHRKFLMNLN